MSKGQKRIWLAILLVLLLWQPQPLWAEEADSEAEINEQLSLLPADEIYALMDELDREMNDFLGGEGLRGFWQGLLHGEVTLDWQGLVNGGLRLFRQEVALNISLVGKMIFLIILGAVLGRLNDSFGQDGAGKLAHLVVIFMILLLVVGSVRTVTALAEETVARLVGFMQLLMPVEFILMAALGNGAALAALSPVGYVGINLLGNLFRYLVLPLIYFEVLLKITNCLSTEFRVEKLADLFRTVIMSLIGLSSTVFLALIGLGGMSGATVDGLSARAVKYAASTFVPVVGGMLSDAYETMAGGALLLKNAFGLVGMLIIIVLLAAPAVKIFVVYLLYKFTAAIVEPLGEKQATEMLSRVGDSFLLVFAMVVFVALTFFFTIVILTATANSAVMLR